MLDKTQTGRSIGFSLFLSWSLFELHLTKVDTGCRAPVQTHLLWFIKAQDSERFLPQSRYSRRFSQRLVNIEENTEGVLELERIRHRNWYWPNDWEVNRHTTRNALAGLAVLAGFWQKATKLEISAVQWAMSLRTDVTCFTLQVVIQYIYHVFTHST